MGSWSSEEHTETREAWRCCSSRTGQLEPRSDGGDVQQAMDRGTVRNPAWQLFGSCLGLPSAEQTGTGWREPSRWVRSSFSLRREGWGRVGESSLSSVGASGYGIAGARLEL